MNLFLLSVPLAELFFEIMVDIIPNMDILVLIGLIFIAAIMYLSNSPLEACLILGLILIYPLSTVAGFTNQLWIILLVISGLALGFAWNKLNKGF
jgi:hypothetical protein